MKQLLFLISASLVLAGCEHFERRDLKSPCVSLGSTDGPCERFPINTASSQPQKDIIT